MPRAGAGEGRTTLLARLLRLTAGMAGTDARVAAASRGFAQAELRSAALLRSGTADNDPALRTALARRRRHAAALCTLRARTADGHRARALAFSIWDDGEFARRAEDPGFLEDKLLWALLNDLTGPVPSDNGNRDRRAATLPHRTGKPG